MKTDLEIAHTYQMMPIMEIGKKLGLTEDQLSCYGKYKAKIINTPQKSGIGKLILVTSTNPTPYGEGKTTMSIGLADALCALGKKALPVLREPSLGPVFGMKGGATGGGQSQVVPMDEINLHFTGDLSALTAANNLLCAAIDNHLFQGNLLQIDPNTIQIPRAMDMNDRALRHIEVGIQSMPRADEFVITVASELMAILCLADDLMDLKQRIGNIVIGLRFDQTPVYVRDLKVAGAMTILLKDAIKPNLVQTLEGNPAIIHGGPFANIAHGCNSLIATHMGLKLADYVVTEAGFGSDLGAEKFFNIKCRKGSLKPDCVIMNTTIRSLKYNGAVEKNELRYENMEALESGISNLKAHIENMKTFTDDIIVCLNQFDTDTNEELSYVSAYCEAMGVSCVASTCHKDGSKGSLELAKKVISTCMTPSQFSMTYEDKDSLLDKIEKVSTKIYHASGVTYRDGVINKIKNYESLGYQTLPICIAKTQYSMSDDPKKLGFPTDHTVLVRDVKLNAGAGFVVVYMGDIMTMPGLSKHPNYEAMEIDANEKITGLF